MDINPFSFPTLTTYLATVAMSPAGDFIVVWFTYGGDIQARVYNSTGSTGEFTVNSSSTGYDPSVAYDETRDEWVVVWSGAGPSDPDGIYLRRIDNNGAPLGAELLVNQTPSGGQFYPSVDVGHTGDVLVGWSGPDANGSGVFGRLFDASGTPVGGEFAVNLLTLGSQYGTPLSGRKTVAISDHRLVFAWQGSTPGDGDGVAVTVLSPIITNYCSPAVPNSTGSSAWIFSSGSPVATNNNFNVIAAGLPPNQFGYFIAGQFEATPPVPPPGSQGLICMTLPSIGRFNQPWQIIQGPAGSLQVDLTAIPVNPPAAVLAGDTWNFQCWYRDNNPGPTSNFTDALRVTFQ
ncbi:MAG: hypothetical protein GY711_02490 [bacterium]|nr:hypothetical protein [bacterium]